ATGSSIPRSTTSPTARREGSGLRLWRRSFGAAAAFGHDLIEFGCVLGVAQPVQELEEVALLVFEPAQRFGAILVEGAVAARGLTVGPAPAGAPGTPVARCRLHALHALLHAVHAPLPAFLSMHPASHATTSYQISENDKANRPPQQKAHDHQRDPSRLAYIVQACRDSHSRLLM